ncbi:MAG: hypothetical protein COX79_02475 [Candidatus Levybacteria bacterium CG_4_10_14_0_2_um_filter_36_16]|nr:MAG: hypothetical protein COX79_02475 [Candidatus Levybacteria bacterium CG_4_10_14_0_2_um_filter_36_16]
MNTNQKILTGVITGAIIVLLALTFLIGGGNVTNKIKQTGLSSQPNNTLATTTPILTQIPNPNPGETIMVTIHGFVPDTLRIKKGTSINFANFADTAVDIESADHPTHKLYPQLNIGTIEASDTTDPLLYDKLGTYKYHNHLKPEQTGTIIVE